MGGNFQQQPRNEQQDFQPQQRGGERLEDLITRLFSKSDKRYAERFLQTMADLGTNGLACKTLKTK
ncbi:hypothetical protein Hanom_Chr14g01262401 [Helianthus anomalus]